MFSRFMNPRVERGAGSPPPSFPQQPQSPPMQAPQIPGPSVMPPEVAFANRTMLTKPPENANGLPSGGFGQLMQPPQSPMNMEGLPQGLPPALMQALAMQQRGPGFQPPSAPPSAPQAPGGMRYPGGSGGMPVMSDPRMRMF